MVGPHGRGRAREPGPSPRASASRPRSPGAAGIVLAAFLGFSLLGFMFLTGSTGGLLGWNALPEARARSSAGRRGRSRRRPRGSSRSAGSGSRSTCCSASRRAAACESRASASRRSSRSSAPSRAGRHSASSCSLLAVAGWITTPLHGVGEAWVALGALLLFLLGGVLDRSSLRANVDLGFLLFLGVVSSLSGVASAVKADRWLMTRAGAHPGHGRRSPSQSPAGGGARHRRGALRPQQVRGDHPAGARPHAARPSSSACIPA